VGVALAQLIESTLLHPIFLTLHTWIEALNVLG
jgi:hypothetical protein